MTEHVQGPIISILVTCPACHAVVPLPSIVVTSVLEMTTGGTRLTARLTEMPNVEHECD